MGRQFLRGTAWSIMMVVLAAAFLIALPGEARACSCAAPPPPEEAIVQHEWVFVGRQVGRYEVTDTDSSWGQVRLQIEVLAVFKGDVPDTVELHTGRGGGDCGIDLAGYLEVGFTVTPNAEGEVGVGRCGGTMRADVLRLFFETLPGRVGSGPPGFLVGTEIGPARVAILDTAGELLTYAEGDGRLAAAAVCPGARKVVEVVEHSDSGQTIGGEFPPTLEVRDLATLAIESTHPIDISARDPRQLNGMGWVFDLQCHDPGARLVSYLLPNGVWDDIAGANLPGPAQLHLWQDGQLTAVEAGEARAIAVDPEAGRFYAITGKKGKILETRDLTGRLIESERLPGTHIGWRLAISPDRSELAVLALSKPLDRGNWYYALVDRLLVFDLATGRMDWHPLPAAGFALLLQADDSGFLAAVGQYEVYPVMVDISRLGSRVAGEGTNPVASLTVESRPESGMDIGPWGPLAVGSEAVVFTAASEGILGQVNVWAHDLGTGGEAAMEGLVRSRLAIPLPPGTEITNLPPPATTTTTPETTTSIPAPSTCTTAPLAGATTTTQAVLPPGSEEDADGRWVPIALIAAAALLAAGGVTLVVARAIRSRRGSSTPNDGPGQAPDAGGR